MSKYSSFKRDTGMVDGFDDTATFKQSRLEKQTGKIAAFPDFVVPPSSNLWGWWNASNAYTDDGTTLCSSSGSDTCKQLNDLSGNSRHLTQSTAGNRPTWYSSQQNGYPALRFDGSNDELGKSSLSQAQPLTVLLVFKQISWTLNDDIIAFDTTGNGLRIQQTSSSPIIQVVAGTSGVSTPSSTPSLGSYHLVWSVINGSSSKIQVDNDAEQTGGSGTGSLSKVFLGSGDGQQWSNIDACEVLVYSSALTSSSGDGLSARRYLNSKYNLGLSL